MLKQVNIEQLFQQFSLEEINKRDDVVIVDVREQQEYSHEHIDQSLNIPLRNLSSLESHECQDKIAIFHCRSGKRTALNEAVLANTPFKEKYCLSGGFNQWKEAGLPTRKEQSAPVDVMRQVQIIVGCMILLGIGLSYAVSTYFILIAIFAGCGMLVAGFTGFCGMAEILKFLPWNKSRKHS